MIFGEQKVEPQKKNDFFFDIDLFFAANPQIQKEIDNGIYESKKDFLESVDIVDEVKNGSMKFHPLYTPFEEEKYFSAFPDVKAAVTIGNFKSAFEHFSHFGYKEIMENQRLWPKVCDDDLLEIKEEINAITEEQQAETSIVDKRDSDILKDSGVFDKEYYLINNPDIQQSDMDPLEHYYNIGWKEGRKPNNWFDPLYYYSEYADVKIVELEPLTHYILVGHLESRRASPDNCMWTEEFEEAFDKEYYLINNPDVKQADLDPIVHYYYNGWQEGRRPNDWFDPEYYLETYEDVFELNIEPLQHYLECGKSEGRHPALKLKVDKSLMFDYANLQTKKSEYHKDFVPYKEYDVNQKDIKLIAFYLPQYHPVSENDKAWGKGFTEWTNVCKALPQFDGHYQPRLPGELGHYDLRLLDVQRRQIELAKNYGLYGFCYHYYWFNGEKVLEKPLEQLLEHPELDFPFCVNWANENWTKKWDGLDDDVILHQEYSKEEDINFIEDVSRLFKDPRYIHISGKPLLMIYRPAHFPNIKKTVKRWRKWCHKNGVGEIYLMMTHSFEQINPEEIGFDATTEFSPNSVRVTSIKNELCFFNKNYDGHVNDYKELIKISSQFKKPEYVKYRSLCPSWDNEARKPGKGSTYHHSSPELYQNWLEDLCKYTDEHFEKENKLIFINAWNEWGEGAYLEPDQKFGYGYLDATYQALLNYKTERKKIIYVGHDAHFHGAQLLSLNIIRVLRDHFKLDVHMILKTGGELEEEYKNYATVYNLESDYPSKKKTKELIRSLYEDEAIHAICNTTVSGDIVKLLSKQGVTTISLIHELPTLIKNYKMEDNASFIAKYADHVVFPSHFVKDGFETITKLSDEKAIISPQGLYQVNRYQDHVEDARTELRELLNLDADAKIILGSGFADHRKGIDIFVEVALKVAQQMDNTYFVWVGNVEQTMQKYISDTFSLEDSNVIFVPVQSEISVYYSGADLYLMTSREDPFPSVVMEAMNVKVPVIGFENAGGFIDIVTEETGILVEYENDMAMASAVVELLEDDEKRAALGETSLSLIRNDFVWKDYIYKLLELVGMPYKKVSVVVPNYNYEKYIGNRLKSIEDQAYPIYELLYLEDCSPDNSLEVAKEFFAQTKVEMQITENETNSGSVFKQWAKGISLAKGDYVWIAEADDLADPDFLPEVMKGFDDPEVVLSYSQSKQIDQDDNLVNETYLAYTKDIDKDKWLSNYIRDGKEELADTLVIKNTIPNVSGVVFKKYDISPILEKLLTFKVGGDWYFYLWLLEKGKISYNAKSLNSHRRHINSVTVSPENNQKHFQEIIEMQELIYEQFEVSGEIWESVLEYREKIKEYLGVNK